MESMSTTMAWHCVRSIMTVIRACMYRMTTTTVSPVGAWDVIDLTAKLFDLRLYDAARKLASDFHLAPDKPLPEAIRRKKEHKTRAQQLRENERLCFSVLNEYRRLLLDWEKTVCTASAGRCAGRAVCGSLPPSAMGRVSAGHPFARRFL